METRRLYRSETDRIIGGVCAGLGIYMGIDPLIVRIVFLLLFFLGHGAGFLLYIILWIIMPSQSHAHIPSSETVQQNMHEVRNSVTNFFSSTRATDMQFIGGIILILIGLGFFAGEFGIFDFFDFGKLWPVGIILLGIFLLFRR